MLEILKPKRFIILTTAIFIVIFSVVFLLPEATLAQSDDMFGVNYGQGTGLSTTDIRISVVRIIRAILGVLGIVALCLIIYGGFVWMTAGGNSEKIEKAKKILVNTVIGLIIIFMAFAIIQYIFKVLEGGQGSNAPICQAQQCYGCSRCLDDGSGYLCDESCGITSAPCVCSIGPSMSEFVVDAVHTSHGAPLSNGLPEEKSNVHWCSKVQTIFNRNVDISTIVDAHNADNLKIAAIAGIQGIQQGNWDARSNVLVYSPLGSDGSSTFDNREVIAIGKKHNHEYDMPSSIEDASPEPLFLRSCSIGADCDEASSAGVQWNFFVGNEGDEVDPFIVSAYPRIDDANPDMNVSRDPVVDVTFSENIDATSILDVNGINPYPGRLYFQKVESDGSLTQIANNLIHLVIKNNGFRFYLEDPNLLDAFTAYQVTVQDVTDLCNNKMLEPVTWRFTTNDRVPGVAGYYPTGTNACPDTRTSITFNTSMYYDEVTLNIGVEGYGPSTYILAPDQDGKTSTTFDRSTSENILGEFRIVDVDGNNISNNYRVFEFIPTGGLVENTSYYVNVVTNKIINADRTALAKSWEFGVTDLSACVCAPYITHLSKDQGPIGDCLTLSGYCFTGTQEQPATIEYINFDSKDAQVGAGYSNRAVGTTVPAEFNQGDRPQVSLAINYSSGNNVPPSNSKEFYITPGEATGPCLWSINPDQGPPGTNLTLGGTRLLPLNVADLDGMTTSQVVFTPGVPFEVTDINNWTNDLIKGVIVPNGAKDGPAIINADHGQSNGIFFNVWECGDNVIDPGEECDLNNVPGECQDHGFVGGNLLCYSSGSTDPITGQDVSCYFDTTSCSNAPGVVENSQCLLVCDGGDNHGNRCFRDSDCQGTAPTLDGQCVIDVIPSANPFRNSRDACLNTIVSANFNIDLDPASVNSSNIFMQKCDDDTCQNVNSAHLATALTTAGSKSFRLDPDSNLAINTTYQVTITTGVSSLVDNVPMQNPYIWHFKTKNDAAPCPIERVYVEPPHYIINGANVAGNYRADAVAPLASTNCALISQEYDWQWGIDDPDLGVDAQEDGADDAHAIITSGTQAGSVYVRATNLDENKFARGSLNINIDSCRLAPGVCDQNCPGSVCDIEADRCTPVIQSLSPDNGPAGRWTTIQGCYFKSKGQSSSINFGSTQVSLYPCSSSWTDTQVIVEVPVVSQGSHVVTLTDAYGLNTVQSNNGNGNFTVTSNCNGITDNIPGICSLSRYQGQPGDAVGISGSNFGTTKDLVTFNNITAATSNWLDANISTQVPDSASTGDVIATVASCPSNGLKFTIAGGGEGAPCDSNLSNQPVCDADNNMCWQGFWCDPDANCTCQKSPSPSILSYSPTGTDACRNAMVSLTFDREMNLNSINSTTLKLEYLRTDGRGCDGQPPANVYNPTLKDRVIAFFRNLLSKESFAQSGTYCPVDGKVTAHNVNGKTVTYFRPSDLLGQPDSSVTHRIFVAGKSNGVKSVLGGIMENDYTDGLFTVGKNVCDINHVNVNITSGAGSDESTKEDTAYDYFTCVTRLNGCPDDVNPGVADNQHGYLATARDISDNLLVADFAWKENPSSQSLIILSATDTEEVEVTPVDQSGNTTLIVTGFDPDDGDPNYGSASQAITITNFICQNPWPSFDQAFPFNDSLSNCASGFCHDMTFSAFYCRDFGNSEKYCQDSGLACADDSDCPDNSDCPRGECVCLGSDTDDLPALAIPGTILGETNGTCIGGANHGAVCAGYGSCGLGYCRKVMKEFLFSFPQSQDNNTHWCENSLTPCQANQDCVANTSCQLNTDVVGIRIYSNSEHLSPSAWYKKYMGESGGHSMLKVDNYDALSVSQDTFIGTAVDTNPTAVDTNPTGSHNIFTNIFRISYSVKKGEENKIDELPNPITREVFQRFYKNFVFNANLGENLRLCTNSDTWCTKDSQCGTGSCQAPKDKLARDARRIGGIGEMSYHLELYRGHCSLSQNLACHTDSDCPEYIFDDPRSEICVASGATSYPTLSAGSYLQGQSVSLWDSWPSTLSSEIKASLLLDPLNEGTNCPDDVYNKECWDLEAKNFKCEPGSHMFHYKSGSNGNSYDLYANMEYSNTGWQPANSHYRTNFVQPCSPGTYNLIYNSIQSAY